MVTTDILDLNGRQIQRELIYNISQIKETIINEAGSPSWLSLQRASDSQAQALEVLRELNSSFESAVEPYGILSSRAVSWAYTIASGPLMFQLSLPRCSQPRGGSAPDPDRFWQLAFQTTPPKSTHACLR